MITAQTLACTEHNEPLTELCQPVPGAIQIARDRWLLAGPCHDLPAGAMPRDQSSGYRVFSLAGPEVEEFLSGCCRLDWQTLPDGVARRTLIGQVSGIVHRRSQTAVDLYLPFTLADSVLDHLGLTAQ